MQDKEEMTTLVTVEKKLNSQGYTKDFTVQNGRLATMDENNAPTYSTDSYSLYTAAPGGLGVTRHTIGSPRQVPMSLRFQF